MDGPFVTCPSCVEMNFTLRAIALTLPLALAPLASCSLSLTMHTPPRRGVPGIGDVAGGSTSECVKVAYLTTWAHRLLSPEIGGGMARERTTPDGTVEEDAPAPAREAPVVERRATPRLDKVFPVFLDGERGVARGVARNISEGGMFVETAEPQPLGSHVRVTFPANAGDMTAVAEVRYVCHLVARVGEGERWTAVRGMGMRFLYFDPAGAAPPVLH